VSLAGPAPVLLALLLSRCGEEEPPADTGGDADTDMDADADADTGPTDDDGDGRYAWCRYESRVRSVARVRRGLDWRGTFVSSAWTGSATSIDGTLRVRSYLPVHVGLHVPPRPGRAGPAPGRPGFGWGSVHTTEEWHDGSPSLLWSHTSRPHGYVRGSASRSLASGVGDGTFEKRTFTWTPPPGP